MNNHVEYITAIIDGLELAVPDSKKKELYQEYTAKLIAYNTVLKEDAQLKASKVTLKKIITFDAFCETAIRSIIINKLMDSSYSCYFQDLTPSDILKILGNSISKHKLTYISKHAERILGMFKNRDKFEDIQETINLLNTGWDT